MNLRTHTKDLSRYHVDKKYNHTSIFICTKYLTYLARSYQGHHSEGKQLIKIITLHDGSIDKKNHTSILIQATNLTYLARSYQGHAEIKQIIKSIEY